MNNIKEHINILIAMTLINLFVLWNFISEGKTIHGIGYFIFFYVALFIIHFFTDKYPPKIDIEIKQPKREFLMIILFSFLGAIFITINFYLKTNTEQIGFLVQLPLLIGILLFTFPLGIVVYLMLKKYKLLQLGLNIKPLSYLILGLIIWGITGLFAFIFNKSGIIWVEGYKELGGVPGIILKGIIGAGLVEEFNRFAIQSRFEKVFKQFGFNILFATTIWAFMHFPVNYFKESMSISEIFIYCIQIIPIGFIWGYLTQRTKSIVPATLAHGINLWGFQNG
ncbi:MAG: CPBP family intramembrane metalloprotease [Flavobacteriales bacterium]|nr:CPBP family intramembrane metalloprotease [Bacteroidota bacterium]MCB9263345.1 CPBP family intramembrane metalloprotease [Flavobacteriales bacterium]